VIDRKLIYLGLLLGLLATTLSAEVKYVTDDLQLALHEKSGSKGKLLQKLASGTELEVLEEQGLFAKVRTAEGIVGWTKAGFLMTDKPARTKLIELETEQAELLEQLDKLRAQLDENKQLATALRAEKIQTALELADAREKKDLNATQVTQLQEQLNGLQKRVQPVEGHQIPLHWGLLGMAVSLFLGILGGIALFDWMSRRRHGGFRIY
jgi:SH3 domain protein